MGKGVMGRKSRGRERKGKEGKGGDGEDPMDLLPRKNFLATPVTPTSDPTSIRSSLVSMQYACVVTIAY